MCSARRRSADRRRRSRGFSLLEAVTAAGFLSLTLLALAGSGISLTRNQKTADSTAAAHALAQQKLEQLRSMPLAAPNLASGSYNDAGNPLQANGTTGGIFTRSWSVSANDTPANGLKTVTVSVGWTDSRAHTTTIAAFVRCSNNPCT